MKLRVLSLFSLFLLTLLGPGSAVSRAEETPTRLLRNPDVSATRIVFVYAGDLWIAPREGGQARRLTSHVGEEVLPRFSPDGNWVAYSASYDGNMDVYVIAADGGEPRRLTFHPSYDLVADWRPDGKKILFLSSRISAPARYPRYFEVDVEQGGIPQALPIHHGGPASYSPDGNSIAYDPRARESRTWKRYRGGRTGYVAIFHLKDNSYEELPRPDANDFWPMWDTSGIYFASDRDGHLNLWRWDLSAKKAEQLTHFTEYDLKWPALGPGAIVFENGGQVHLYDLESGQEHAVPIIVRGELLVARPKLVSLQKKVRSASISPHAKRVVLEARGEIFTVPAENGPTRQLTHSSGVFERDPVWSPKGDRIAYFSDRGGEWALYLQDKKGGDETKLVDTRDHAYPFDMTWSPDGKKIVYTDNHSRMWCVEVDTGKHLLVDSSPVRGGVSSPAWSPDGRWLAYQKSESYGNDDIWLWSYEKRQSTQVTTGFYNDFDPVFDLGGKYLYFASSRNFYPSGDVFDWHFSYHLTDGLFAVVLSDQEPSPFAPQNDEEELDSNGKDDGKKDGKDGDGEKKEKDGKKDEIEPITVDLDGIGQRVVALPVSSGNYQNLQGGRNKLFYGSSAFESEQMARPDAPHGFTLKLFDMEEREENTVLDGVSGFMLDAAGKKLLYRGAEGGFAIVDAKKGQKKSDGKLDLSRVQARVDYREEWAQIFHEAWRIERDFFWDPDMGGKDWKKIGRRYEKLLPWVAHRRDLNYLIGELIGELATSHSYVGGGDLPHPKGVSVGLLGVDFAGGEKYWKLAKIYRGEDWDKSRVAPLARPGLEVAEGDYLIAVDGVEVPGDANPYAYFQGKGDREVALLVNHTPRREGAHEILVKTITSESGLRYLDWVETKRAWVDQATDGKVGYMHVPNTSIAGLREFDKYLQAQSLKQALIVDERFNAGGMIPDFYTDKLKKRLLNFISPRNGEDTPWPPRAIYGPKVLIVNEFAGSGGDAFPWYFQQEKIGPVIGMRTWGGLVGISRQLPLIDGGRVTAPEIAFWSPENGGEWIVENHGVDPDIVVDNRPDLEAKGQDPQLEKAVEVILEKLKREKPWPPRPPYPRGR